MIVEIKTQHPYISTNQIIAAHNPEKSRILAMCQASSPRPGALNILSTTINSPKSQGRHCDHESLMDFSNTSFLKEETGVLPNDVFTKTKFLFLQLLNSYLMFASKH